MQVRRRVIREWDNADGLTTSIGYRYLLKKKKTVTHAGRTTTRMVVRDANGEEVTFPMSLAIEMTFHDVES